MPGLDVEALLDETAREAAAGREERPRRRSTERPRSRDRERDRHADRDRDRDRDRERDRGDRRDRRRRSRSPRRRRSPSRDRESRRERSRSRERRRRDDRRRREPTPPPNDEERDRRTIFVQQLAARLRTRELAEFFGKAGAVAEAQIVKDRVSGRSKGVGYVEFRSEESIAAALQLTGERLLGIPVIVQLTEAEKNRQARVAQAEAQAGAGQAPFHRLYVGNIHFNVTEEDLRTVFEPFGELETVQLQKDEGARSRGYGFVQFRVPNAAREALDKMNGFDLAGRAIRVGLGSDKFTTESTQNLMHKFTGADEPSASGSKAATSPARRDRSHSRERRRSRDRGGRRDRARDRDSARDRDTTTRIEDGDVNFANFSRDALMRKLARRDEPSTSGTSPISPQLPVAVGSASRCVLLRNMFDPAEEAADGSWVAELEEDVRNEASSRYGKVVHISVDRESKGDVYIKFDKISGGEAAIKGFNGRFFAGRRIDAQPVVDAVYSNRFSRTRAV